MDILLEFIQNLGWWGALLVGLFGYWMWVLSGLHEEGNAARDRWVGILRADPRQRYQRVVMRGMDWIDRKLTPEAFGDDRVREPGDWRSAFSFSLLNITLVLALLYPVLSLMVQWVIKGTDASVGGEIIVPAEPTEFRRYLAFGEISFSLLCVVLSRRSAAQSKTGLAVFWIALAFAGSIAGSFVIAIAGAFAIALAGVYTGALAGALTGALAVAFAGVFAGAIAVSGTFTALVVVACVISGLVFKFWLGLKYLKPTFALISFTLFMIVVISVVVSFQDQFFTIEGEVNPIGTIVFIGLLPLLNGLCDFLSTAMTRRLIRKGGLNPAWWIADLAFALLTLSILAASFIAFITFVTPQNSVPLLDLPRLFNNIEANPSDYWWLSFMLFSTLLPTLLHFVIALGSCYTFIPGKLRLYIAAEVEMGVTDKSRGRYGKLLLSALNAFSFWLPIVVLISIGLFFWNGEHGLWRLLLEGARWLH
ncbi:MAG: hypothetical protein ACPGGK_06885, partial [Pikeienuella sp.]